jgi:hypothetical protein
VAITIDYNDPVQYVINIPRADMTLIQSNPTEIRQLNIDDFRTTLMDLQDNVEHVWAPTTHLHTAPHTLSGVTYAREVQILDPYVMLFEDGQYNVNIVGGNSNVSDVTVKNQVGINTANSAGLQDPFALQAAAFGGKVCLDQNAVQSGITFPFGTRGNPVNNVADALAIASGRGICVILLLSDTTLGSGDFSSGYCFEGDQTNILLTLQAAPNVTNCEFKNLTIQGDLDGANTLRECSILNLNYFNGFIWQCGFGGTVTLFGTATAVILQCFSFVAGAGPGQYPTIDLGGNHETPLVIRDWNGGLGIANASSQSASCSIDMSSGRVIFEDTITAGTYTVRGIVSSDGVVDNSGPGTTVQDMTITADITRTRRHQTNRFETDPDTGVATIYDDDGVTPLETSDMYEDIAGAQTYRGRGAERRDPFS